jgi:AraC-like DNA-binding protein
MYMGLALEDAAIKGAQPKTVRDARRVLASSGSVTDAALESGYGSGAAFIVAFKQTFGSAPDRKGRMRSARANAVRRASVR